MGSQLRPGEGAEHSVPGDSCTRPRSPGRRWNAGSAQEQSAWAKLSPENKEQKWRREAIGRAVLHHFEILDTTAFPSPPRSADDVRMGEEMEDEEA